MKDKKATIAINNTRFRVQVGDKIFIEIPDARHYSEENQEVAPDQVCLLEENDNIVTDPEKLEKVSVKLGNLKFLISKKIEHMKYKRRKRYQKFSTQRRRFIRAEILSIRS
jgi:ribosomal protein L21